MEAALIAKLLAASGVTSLLSTRLSWVTRPQGEAYPAGCLQLVDGSPEYTHAGREGLERSRIQFDVWARTFAASTAASDAVITALTAPFTQDSVRFQAIFVEQKRDTFDGDGPDKLFRRSLDLIVWHNPTA